MENSTERTAIRAIAFIICVLIMTIGGCQCYTKKAFVDGGYEEGSLPGLPSSVWVKTHRN